VTELAFRFRLERVRALRARNEELAQQELAKSISALSHSQDRLRAIDAHLQRARAEQLMAASGTAPVSAGELLASQAFVERVEDQRNTGVRDIEHHEAQVADRDAELGLAALEHQMLERLKERHHDLHRRETQRRETATLDEIALERFRRSAA
jgi:flagellar FliJ protein